MDPSHFSDLFSSLTGYTPYHWQKQLYEDFVDGNPPGALSLPTGSGKTSLMVVWLLALATAKSTVPRRLVWVVNRRVVVDQATGQAGQLRDSLKSLPALLAPLSQLGARRHDEVLAISTLRGELADNGEWSDDASRPAIIIGTVDMVGSRLLFSGYGDSRRMRPRHAGLLGHDALIVNDEAHLTPAFAELLVQVQQTIHQRSLIRPFWTMRLSATQRHSNPSDLSADLAESSHFLRLWSASKQMQIVAAQKADQEIVRIATESPAPRTVVFVRSPETAKTLAERIAKITGSTRVLVLSGEMRGFERDRLALRLQDLGFLHATSPEEPSWLVSTSAGEVGINLSCERMITELDTAERLLQRFGRLNRFAEASGVAWVVFPDGKTFDRNKDRHARLEATLNYLSSLPSHPHGGFDISVGTLQSHPPPIQACTPPPLLAQFHPWLISLWSQTSIRPPQAPPVEPWLHGKQEDLAETQIAWRREISSLENPSVPDEDLNRYLELCPVLAHERLRMPSPRLFEWLQNNLPPETSLLLVRNGQITRALRSALQVRDLAFALLLLPTEVAGLRDGHLHPSWDDSPRDVSHELSDPPLWRCSFEDPEGQAIHAIPLSNTETLGESPNTLYILKERRAQEKSAQEPMLDQHTAQVLKAASRLSEALDLPADLQSSLASAARWHDAGKAHPVWQKFANGPVDGQPLAKVLGTTSPRRLAGFRHEFESLRRMQADDDLAAHLVASHHGFARPSFPESASDKNALSASRHLNLESARRYARLSERFGDWGLAYLEAVFHTADALGSLLQEVDQDA
jgi:CRISPR-associated endonuclease/helicase Cas3